MSKRLNKEACSECGASFQGQHIPAEYRSSYGMEFYFSRLVGIYDMDQDCTVRYQCPDCKAQWDRFTGEFVT